MASFILFSGRPAITASAVILAGREECWAGVFTGWDQLAGPDRVAVKMKWGERRGEWKVPSVPCAGWLLPGPGLSQDQVPLSPLHSTPLLNYQTETDEEARECFSQKYLCWGAGSELVWALWWGGTEVEWDSGVVVWWCGGVVLALPKVSQFGCEPGRVQTSHRVSCVRSSAQCAASKISP